MIIILKMKNLNRTCFLLILTACALISHAQTASTKDRKINLNKDGSQYVKVTMLNQVWLRQQSLNEGSTIFGFPEKNHSDIGIRRFRVQAYSQLSDNVFIYTQWGENNFNNIADRKLGFFIHDAIGEYAVDKKKLSVGAGLTAWSGLSRFAAPAVGAILGVDAPLFQQSTNDVTDQFLRKLSMYAKGKIGKIDYRLSISDPMAIQKSNYNTSIGKYASFSQKPARKQWNTYIQYQLKEEESNLVPYMPGTYLGKKNILTLGIGSVYQPKAMWRLADNNKDTIESNMLQLAADVFMEKPIGKKGAAFNAYACFTHFDFGSNYIRNAAVMNPANGTTNTNILNGSGNGFPMYGTGNVWYLQAGYKLKDNFIGHTTLMPYLAIQHANYERLNKAMNFIDIGCNWFLNGQNFKLTAAYQNRPIYDAGGKLTDHKGAALLQMQVFFN